MRKRNRIQLLVALILCAVSIISAGLLQTDFGRVTMTDITLETEAGKLTAYLFKPKSATAENPAPAVLCSHGYLNNREMQDCNYIELARRGYVVISLDDFSHGNSDVPNGHQDSPIVQSNGLIAFIEYLDSLDYVDSTKIGVTGHSMGGSYTIVTMTYYSDLEREALKKGTNPTEAHKLNKINTGVIVGNYPTRMAQKTNGETFLCHCNVIGAKYDEFFFENTAVLLTSDNSKNLVSNILGTRVTGDLEEGKTYTSPTNGYTVTLYNPAQFHATNHFSSTCVKYLLESFDRTMPAPKSIPYTNQVWFLKELCNLIGLIGFFLFVVPFIDLMTQIPVFAAVKEEVKYYEKPAKYVSSNIKAGLINCLLIVPLMLIGYVALKNPIWPQDTTGGIGLWSTGCSLVTLLILKKGFGKPIKGNEKEFGSYITLPKLLVTILLSVIVTVATYCLLFAADLINQTDYRFWSFDIRSFPLKKIWVAIRYIPLYVGYYIVQSIAVKRSTFRKQSELMQILTCGLFNMLAPALMLIITYAPTPLLQATTWVALFSKVGIAMVASVFALIPILLLPIVPIMFITAAIAVRSYRLTGNLYIAAIVNTLLIVMITVANTSFSFPY
ncbi:MAG: alpha/beta hydrolase [Erysipelotrichaceae bacterium]|nr:alpha/beta hydrolase [Erysipelotrichaceae bacterium]